jgi:hypothetical protein
MVIAAHEAVTLLGVLEVQCLLDLTDMTSCAPRGEDALSRSKEYGVGQQLLFLVLLWRFANSSDWWNASYVFQPTVDLRNRFCFSSFPKFNCRDANQLPCSQACSVEDQSHAATASQASEQQSGVQPRLLPWPTFPPVDQPFCFL